MLVAVFIRAFVGVFVAVCVLGVVGMLFRAFGLRAGGLGGIASGRFRILAARGQDKHRGNQPYGGRSGETVHGFTSETDGSKPIQAFKCPVA